MKGFIILAAIALAIGAFGIYEYSREHKLTTYANKLQKIADEVNAANTTWKAGHNSKWDNQTEESIKNFLMPINTIQIKTIDPELIKTHSFEAQQAAPDSFDSREQWPKCETIKEIRDQSACGSCWAFGSSETMSDRICIHSGQTKQTRISAEDLVECCTFFNGMCGMGCNGGNPGAAFSFWKNQGIVDGGLYNDNTTCKPYAFAPCGHHVKSAKYGPCPSAEYSTPSCKKTCKNGKDYKESKLHAKSVYSVSGEADLKTELSTNGPVSVAFTVYADFPTYKSGVYQHTTGSQLGGHAVKMIGYGTENGTPYWLIANSWNETWGDNGFFKIIRGSGAANCGIEDEGNTGVPM